MDSPSDSPGVDTSKHDDASASKLLSSVSNLYKDDSGSSGSYRHAGESLPLKDANVQASSKLRLDDILPTITDASLRKSSKQLQKEAELSKAGATNDKGKKKSKKLDAPISRLKQDKFNRQQALEGSKEALGKWVPTVKQMRAAEHVVFPLPNHQTKSVTKPARNKVVVDDNDELSKKLKDISKISVALENEEMELEKKSQVSKMRLARELMFREEIKAKRQKKIKSKTYRRIKKKEREQHKKYIAMLANEIEAVNPEEEEEDSMLGDVGVGVDAEGGDRAIEHHGLQSGKASKSWSSGGGRGVEGSVEEDDEGGDGEDVTAELAREEQPAEALAAAASIDHAEPEIILSQEPKPRLFNDGFSNSFRQAAQNNNTTTSMSSKPSSKPKPIPEGTKKKQSQESKKRRHEDDDGENYIGLTAQKPAVNPWLVQQPAGNNDNEEDDNGQANPKVKAAIMAMEAPIAEPPKALLIGDGPEAAAENARRAEQASLVKRAFAGDDVMASFAPDDEDEEDKKAFGNDSIKSLPGWGSWTGVETERRENHSKKRKGKKAGARATEANGNPPEKKRKVDNNSKVRVSNKANKKQAKYSASTLPFPFESKQQYERSLRVPIGPEWATKQIFRKSTTPRVLVKHSKVIESISNPIS